MGRCFLFMGVRRHLEITRPGLIYKFNYGVFAHAVHIAIAPVFEWESRGGTAAFSWRSFIGAARRVGFDFIRRTPDDINASTVSLPAGEVDGGKTLVCIRDPPIVFLLEFVFRCTGSRIAPE